MILQTFRWIGRPRRAATRCQSPQFSTWCGGLCNRRLSGPRHRSEVVPSTSDSVAQRSEEPEDQPYGEHNRPDCPHDGNPRDETNDEYYQSENNHEASVTTR